MDILLLLKVQYTFKYFLNQANKDAFSNMGFHFKEAALKLKSI